MDDEYQKYVDDCIKDGLSYRDLVELEYAVSKRYEAGVEDAEATN